MNETGSFRRIAPAYEGRRFDGSKASAMDILVWMRDSGMVGAYTDADGGEITIPNTGPGGGSSVAKAGYWIVRARSTAPYYFFPCSPEYLASTYERVEPLQ